MNADQAALMQAQTEGQQAGEFGFGASLNPYQDDTEQHAVWENARTAAIGYRLNRHVKLAGEIC